MTQEHSHPAAPRGSRLPRHPGPQARLARLATGLACLAAASWTAPLAAQEPEENPGVTLQIDGDRISLSVDENTGLPLLDFVKLTEEITDKVYVYDQDIMSATAQNVTFVGTVQLTRENFFGFFQTMLYIKNFACVIRETGGKEVVQIVNMNGTQRTEVQGNARYVPPEEIPDYANQTGVTILSSIPCEFVKANQAVTTLRPFFGQSGGAAPLQFGSVGSERALLVQGWGPQVYAASRLLDLVDIEPIVPKQETEIWKLEYATAEEIEPILTKVLEDRTRRIQQSGPTGGDIAAGNGPQLTISGLATQNAILVSGAPERVAEALSLITLLDQPIEVSGGDIHVIQLKNVQAEDLEDTLRSFLQEDQQAERAAASTAGTGPQRQPRSTVIVAHPESNSLLVSTTQTKFRQIDDMIKSLDKRQPQVMIEAALVELTTDTLNTLGVELGLLDLGGDDFTRPFGFTSFGVSNFEDTDGDSLPDTRLPDFNSPLQGITGGILSSDDFAIPVIVNALRQDNEANILSLPSVVVNNNETARVSSKEVRPTTTNTQNANNVQQGAGPDQEAGIELSISPSISNDDYLRLNITINVSRFLTTADPNAITGGPRTEREVQTQITLPSGHTMVLGGVLEDTESHSDAGIPILKDIPLIGFLFRRSTDQAVKTNLYFFITPTILDDDEFAELAELTQRRKLEAAQYIGHRRLQLVDRHWTGTSPRTLEDAGATIEDLDELGGFDLPFYNRPTTAPDPSSLPTNELQPINAGTPSSER